MKTILVIPPDDASKTDVGARPGYGRGKAKISSNRRRKKKPTKKNTKLLYKTI
jgi:hypothetical protein